MPNEAQTQAERDQSIRAYFDAADRDRSIVPPHILKDLERGELRPFHVHCLADPDGLEKCVAVFPNNGRLYTRLVRAHNGPGEIILTRMTCGNTDFDRLGGTPVDAADFSWPPVIGIDLGKTSRHDPIFVSFRQAEKSSKAGPVLRMSFYGADILPLYQSLRPRVPTFSVIQRPQEDPGPFSRIAMPRPLHYERILDLGESFAGRDTFREHFGPSAPVGEHAAAGASGEAWWFHDDTHEITFRLEYDHTKPRWYLALRQNTNAGEYAMLHAGRLLEWIRSRIVSSTFVTA